MQELISLSTRVVVMAERGREMLQDIYQAPADKIDLIAHGIPDVAFVDPDLFQGSVRRGGQDGAADLRPALAQQRHRVRAERSAGRLWRSFPTSFTSSWAQPIRTSCGSMAKPIV